MSLLWAKVATLDEEPYEGPYFHGTVQHLEPGDHITPSGGPTTFPSETERDHAYATNEDYAWDYAEKAHNSHFRPGMKIHPRVYEVRPLSTVEKDPQWRDSGGEGGRGYPRGNWSTDVRSRHGFEVLREMPMPDHMGSPEDWR